MHDVSLSLVLQRSRSGQAIYWGEGVLPALHERLLMRLNGYTALGELLDEREGTEEVLAVVTELIERGYAEVIELAAVSDQSLSG
ncbi:MAG: hypothetical protein RLY71_2763 [Pseudomonadota bacterium]|jgi:hypothetical protein